MGTNTSLFRNNFGRIRLKAVFSLALLGAVVYAATQLVPLYWDHYNLRESIRSKLEFAFVHHPLDTQEIVRNEIMELLNSTGAQFEEEDVSVTVDRSRKQIAVEIWYSRFHGLPYYRNPIGFCIKLKNATF